MDVIKNILIEVRPLLRSCNVTLSTDANFVDNYHLKVSIRPNFIVVNYSRYETEKAAEPSRTRKRRMDSTSSCDSYTDSEDETFEYSKFVDVGPYFRLMPTSLSSLKFESGFISFRVLTNPTEERSTFYEEVVTAEDTHLPFNKPTIEVSETDKLIVQCANCSQVLSNGDHVQFRRILELPSDNLDASDWFCHCHGESEVSSKVAPRNADLLYGPCYFLINQADLRPEFLKFNSTRKVLYCIRCFSWLGTQEKGDVCKFWNSNVQFKKLDSDLEVSFYRYNSVALDNLSLSDFLYVIKLGLNNSLASAVSSSCKLLLECSFSEEKTQYILIWVMDKCLNLLKNEPSEELHEIKLKRINTCKFLYKIGEDTNVLKNWHNDISVQTFEISKEMFLEGCRHLNKMAAYIPHSFKKSNDFFVTYLEI